MCNTNVLNTYLPIYGAKFNFYDSILADVYVLVIVGGASLVLVPIVCISTGKSGTISLLQSGIKHLISLRPTFHLSVNTSGVALDRGQTPTHRILEAEERHLQLADCRTVEVQLQFELGKSVSNDLSVRHAYKLPQAGHQNGNVLVL